MEKGEVGGELPVKRNQAENSSASTEIPAKKLARQLDFAAVVAPEQSRVQAHVVPGSVPLVMPQVQLQSRQLLQLQPQSLSQRPSVQPMMRPMVAVGCVAPEMMMAQGSVGVVKPDPPRPRPQPVTEGKESTPKRAKHCNCKHSRCLKLYCECFASGVYCEGCNCNNCHNNVDNDAARKEAIEATLERNPNAFRPKIGNSPHGPRDSKDDAGRHNKGCHCKKSSCLKKYCECFQANIFCSKNCKCIDCKNFEESEERQALFHDHANNMAYIQQAANAAITGAIGSSGFMSTPTSKKRKDQELLLSAKDPLMHRPMQSSQANHVRPSGPSSSNSPAAPVVFGTESGVPGPSKPAYRSLLADIVQPIDLTALAAKMVAASRKVAENHTAKKQNQLSSEAETGPDVPKSAATESSGCDRGDKAGASDSSPDDASDPSRVRPMSPGTLELMCDEQDTTFTENGSTAGATSTRLPEQRDMELYAAQERVVLTIFRDLLFRIVQAGDTKAEEYANARLQSVRQDGPISNGAVPLRADNGTEEPPSAVTSQHSVPSSTATSVRDMSNNDHHTENGAAAK
ncbi:tesmin/TSO1-like CXC 5-like protein [Drosera capensis]